MTEAATVGKLNHPHIINIFDRGVDGVMDWIVMELVEVSALDYACQQGVIHRDIKPANIMYNDESEIKIADFGASLITNMEQTQIAGVGSPAYMSPEQLREDMLTHQTDIYLLGVVMHKLLIGRFPCEAKTPVC